MTDDLLAQLEAVADTGFRDFEAGGVSFRLRPVTTVETLRVVRRFPQLKTALLGGFAEEDVSSILEVLLEAGPEAVAALVAASCGRIGDERLEAALCRQPDDVLLPTTAEVIAITMPDGFEAFFERLMRLAGAAGMLEAPPVPVAAGKRVRKAASPTTRS